MTAMQQYIRENLFCRCDRVITRLAASDLIPRQDIFPDEDEVSEWWLVSRDLAVRLRAASLPVVRFGELYFWGRSGIGMAPENDLELICAIELLPSRQMPGMAPSSAA